MTLFRFFLTIFFRFDLMDWAVHPVPSLFASLLASQTRTPHRVRTPHRRLAKTAATPKSSAFFLAVSGFRPSLPHRPQIQPSLLNLPSSPWRPIPRASPPSSRCTTTTRKRRTPTSPTPLPQRRPPPSPPPRRRPLKPGRRTLTLPWRLRRLPVPRSRPVSKP
jgi:hypothetical protein